MKGMSRSYNGLLVQGSWHTGCAVGCPLMVTKISPSNISLPCSNSNARSFDVRSCTSCARDTRPTFSKTAVSRRFDTGFEQVGEQCYCAYGVLGGTDVFCVIRRLNVT